MRFEKRKGEMSWYRVAIPTTKSERLALRIKYSAIDEYDITIKSFFKSESPFYKERRSKNNINYKIKEKLFPEIVETIRTGEGEGRSDTPSNLNVLGILKYVKGGEIKAAKWRRRHNVELYHIDVYIDHFLKKLKNNKKEKGNYPLLRNFIFLKYLYLIYFLASLNTNLASLIPLSFIFCNI